MINDIDKEILNLVQRDARISNAEVARQVGLAPSAVLERLRKLEDRGLIKGYTANLAAKELGFGITVFVSVRTTDCGSDAGAAISEIPEVLEVHDVAGEDCLLLKIRTKDTDELGKLLRERIKAVPSVISTRTTVVLETFKETTALPLELVETNLPKPSRK